MNRSNYLLCNANDDDYTKVLIEFRKGLDYYGLCVSMAANDTNTRLLRG